MSGSRPRALAVLALILGVACISCAAFMRSPGPRCALERWPELCQDELLTCRCRGDTLSVGWSKECRQSGECGFHSVSLFTTPHSLGLMPESIDTVHAVGIRAHYLSVSVDETVREVHLERTWSALLEAFQMAGTLLRLTRGWHSELRIRGTHPLWMATDRTSVCSLSVRESSFGLRSFEHSVVGTIFMQDVELVGSARVFAELGQVDCDATVDFFEMMPRGYLTWRCGGGPTSDLYLGRLVNVILPCGAHVDVAHLRRERGLLGCFPSGPPYPYLLFEEERHHDVPGTCPSDGQPCLTPAELLELHCGPDWASDAEPGLPSSSR